MDEKGYIRLAEERTEDNFLSTCSIVIMSIFYNVDGIVLIGLLDRNMSTNYKAV